ncbi:MAG: histidine--tRNA ligase [Candidatus Falkowbacteria bacterium]
MPISNQPPKGTADWLPEEFAVRKYIFDAWRRVCQRYGYEEYLTPLVEAAEVYRAKSGEDVGGKELVTFTDQGGRELSIRPEMTPSVTRLVSQIYDAYPKPIRFFSIANFMRNEKPQRGRNREFWQLNVDIFGADSIMAEVEIACIALDVMLEFKPPAGSFSLGFNDRRLIDGVLALTEVLPANKTAVVRIMDKWHKLSLADFKEALHDLAVSDNGIEQIIAFMNSASVTDLAERLPQLADNLGLMAVKQVMVMLSDLGYGDCLNFKPSIIRGFDYYDGVIFELFDHHELNNRALFGGGRYNGLAAIFGSKSFPAVGIAPGDETFKLFLESWGLLEEIKKNQNRQRYYLPFLSESLLTETMALARTLRGQGHEVETSLDLVKLGKALEYANKKQLSHVVIFGESEQQKKVYRVKDMATGEETEAAYK